MTQLEPKGHNYQERSSHTHRKAKKRLEIQIIFGAWKMRGEQERAVLVNRN